MQKHKLKGWATISIALLLLVLLPKTYSLVSVLPLYVLITKGVHISIANGIFLSTMWIVYILTLLFPLYWLLDRFILIFVYLPIAIVFYKDTETAPDQLFLILETLFWDIPLLLWVQIISAIGGRALQPFVSEITESVCMGSVPLAKDVSQLAGLHIGLVINLCREYSGPTDSSYDLSSCWNKIFYSESGYRYEDYGIMQFRVPTADLCEPDYHQLLLGIKCIQNYFNNQKKKNNCEKNKKIYIHCKAGRHRASIFTLCYLISCNYNPEEAILLMKEKRHVVVKSIINSSLIQKFIKNYNQNGKNVDRMIESVVNNSTNHQ